MPEGKISILFFWTHEYLAKHHTERTHKYTYTDIPTSSLKMDLLSVAFLLFFFSLGLLVGRSAKMSVSSLNKSSSFVTAFLGRFFATAVGGAANISSS